MKVRFDRNKPLVGIDDPRDYDVDGRITIFDTRKLGLLIQGNTDRDAPNFSASLSNDTAVNGGTNADGITADVTVSGMLADASRITRIRAGFDSTNTADFLNIRSVVNADGSFTLTPDQLSEVNHNTPLNQGEHILHFFTKDQWNNTTNFNLTFTLDANKIIEINGNTPLSDGEHTIKIIAADIAGNISDFDLSFVLDVTVPLAPTVDLLASNDTGVSDNDNLTNDDTSTLEIAAEAGSTVKLFRDGIEIGEAAANSEGKVELTLDALADGAYEFTSSATDAAGNISNLSSPLMKLILLHRLRRRST